MIMGSNGVLFVGQCLIRPAQSIVETQAVSGEHCFVQRSHIKRNLCKLSPIYTVWVPHMQIHAEHDFGYYSYKGAQNGNIQALRSMAAPLRSFCFLSFEPVALRCHLQLPACEHGRWRACVVRAAQQLSMCVRASRAVITPDFHGSPWHFTKRPCAKQKCLTRIHKTWTNSSLFIASLYCTGICVWHVWQHWLSGLGNSHSDYV